MKAARNFAAAAVLDGKLFVAGGATTRSKGLQTVECFDPETQTWAAAPAMPSFRKMQGILVGGSRGLGLT